MKTPLPTNVGRPALKALEKAEIYYLEDLAKLSESQLLSMHGLGPKALRLLKEALSQYKIT